MADELTVEFNAEPASGNAPLTVHFSYIPKQADVIERTWDFGDGETGTGFTINHTYDEPGQYVATLTIKNGSGSQGQASRQITVLSGSPTGTVAPSAGSVSIIPGIVGTPRPPTATPAPVTATPQAAGNSFGFTDLGGGITLSEDTTQLILAGAIAVIIAAFIIFFFNSMSKRQGKKEGTGKKPPEKPAARPPAPPAPQAKTKVTARAPPRSTTPKKKSEDISQDYIYGLVTGKVGGEAERPRVRQQNDDKKN